MDTIEVGARASPAPRAPRVTNACEACRAAKVKCQTSEQLGICRRCLDSKRECIFKTGPRTRRPRRKRQNLSTEPSGSAGTTEAASTAASAAPFPRLPPPPGPSKTFTIDIPMPSEDDDITDSLAALSMAHDKAIDLLVPQTSDDDDEDYGFDEYEYEYDGPEHPNDYDHWGRSMGTAAALEDQLSHASSLPLGASALHTPPPSSVNLASPADGAAENGTTTRKPQPTSSTKPTTQNSGSSSRRTLASLRLQPQFNLDSAGRLLATFRELMLGHFHCVVVRDDDTVAAMARERPFVLLAILAAASGSRTLQGHSLYDEEFRKVLGLKFVAGGERSLELLQGLVVYIAWYPFHLRPKNKQAFQYMRMIVDIINDLELDVDPGIDSLDNPPTPERLDQIRLYLASYYLTSARAATWGRNPSLTHNDYTARCCDLLQLHSPLPGDAVLAWQVRLERLVEATNEVRRTQRGRSQAEYHIGLMLRGMETQLDEWEASLFLTSAHTGAAKWTARSDVAAVVAASPSIRLATLFTRVFLSGAPLLRLPSPPAKVAVIAVGGSVMLGEQGKSSGGGGAADDAFRADAARLRTVIPAVHAMYDYYLGLDPAVANSFIGIEWSGLILAVILGFRMSFPLAVCPEWDDRAARELVRFDEYIDKLCAMGGEAYDVETIKAGLGMGGKVAGNGQQQQQQPVPRKSMDVLSASKIVLDMVRTKFRKKVAKLEGAASARRSQQQQQQQQHRQQATVTMPEGFQHPEIGTAGRGLSAAHETSTGGCPMMDGSLSSYSPYWDETFTNNLVAGAFAAAEGPAAAAPTGIDPNLQISDDLWTAMTMDWAQGEANFGNM